MRSLRCLCLSAVALSLLVPTLAQAETLYFSPVPHWSGSHDFGHFADPQSWSGINGPTLPTAADTLWIWAATSTEIYANDPTSGSPLAGQWLEVDSIFTDGSAELRFGFDPDLDSSTQLAGLRTNTLIQGNSFLGLYTNVEVLDIFSVSRLVNIFAGTTTASRLAMSYDGRAAVLYGSHLDASEIRAEYTYGTALSVIWQGSSLTATNLLSLESGGTILNMVAPILPGETEPYIAGGSTANIGTFQTDRYSGGTMVRIADGSAADPAFSPETTLTIDDVNLYNDSENTVFDIDRSATLNVTNTVFSAGNDNNLTTLFDIRGGGQANVTGVDSYWGTILGRVDGTGSQLNITSLRSQDGDYQFSNPFFRVSNGASSTIVAADFSDHFEPVFVADGGTIQLGATILQRTSGVIADASNNGTIDLGILRSTGGTDLAFRANGSTLKIGNRDADQAGSWDPLGSAATANDVEIIAENNSVLQTYSTMFQTSDSFLLRVHDSTWTGKVPTGFGGDYWRTTSVNNVGGTSVVDVQNSTLDGVWLEARGGTDITLKNSTGRLWIDAFGPGKTVLDNFQGVIGNSHHYNFAGEVQTVDIRDSQFDSTAISLGGFGTGHVDTAITGSRLSTGFLSVGGNGSFDTTSTGTLDIFGASEVGTSGLALGAWKYYEPNARLFFGGGGSMKVRQNSKLSVGGYANANPIDPDYSWSNITAANGPAVVTLGPTSSLELSSGGSAYVGEAWSEAEKTFLPDTLAVGSNGVLNGTGTIIGNVVIMGGLHDPGFSPGHQTVDGTYTMSSGTLILEVGGSGLGDYDQITATGGFNFSGGKIVLKRYGGYTGVGDVGKTFNFLIGPSFNWTGFDFVTGIDDQTGMKFSFNADGSGQFTEAVPEPASMAALGLGALAALRRRKKA